jgi:lipid-A-disaccharide synthase
LNSQQSDDPIENRKSKIENPNIAIFSGELSGDLIGGALARELKALQPDVTLWGLGSNAMRAEGVELLADSAAWGAIGVVEALGKVPSVLRMLPKVKRELRTRRPDVVVLIDFGAFNVPVARAAKQLGLKVCYDVPPGSWRRTGNKGAELAQVTDLIAAPFPWAAERYQSLGANAVYVGHPLVERVKSSQTREQFAAQFGMDASRPIVGLLPGSRHHEVAHLMPTLLDAARLISAQVADAQFVIGVAPSISEEMMAEYLVGHHDLRDKLTEIWHEFAVDAETKILRPITKTAERLAAPPRPVLVAANGVPVPDDILESNADEPRPKRPRGDKLPPPTVLAKGMTYEVMAHSDVLLTCSGTATLEAALFTTPMVILYRGSKLMEWEYRLRGIKKKITHIGLPNILAGKTIVPELIQDAATPEAIAENALQLLNDPMVRRTTRQELKLVKEALGEPGASRKTAELILDMVKN